jgi:hypothetical protein
MEMVIQIPVTTIKYGYEQAKTPVGKGLNQ